MGKLNVQIYQMKKKELRKMEENILMYMVLVWYVLLTYVQDLHVLCQIVYNIPYN